MLPAEPAMGDASTPEAVLQQLQTRAEHLAALKMFYAAADVFRSYAGPLAEETRLERERRALEYEACGAAAERERQLHGTTLHSVPPPAAPPSSIAPQCPGCRRTLPVTFVICPFCGLDFRTGKTFQPVPTAPVTPSAPVVTPPEPRQPRRDRHSREPVVNPWAVIALLLAVLLLISLLRGSGPAPAQPKSRSVVPPPFMH
jgi:hypothetical protein